MRNVAKPESRSRGYNKLINCVRESGALGSRVPSPESRYGVPSPYPIELKPGAWSLERGALGLYGSPLTRVRSPITGTTGSNGSTSAFPFLTNLFRFPFSVNSILASEKEKEQKKEH